MLSSFDTQLHAEECFDGLTPEEREEFEAWFDELEGIIYESELCSV